MYSAGASVPQCVVGDLRLTTELATLLGLDVNATLEFLPGPAA